MNHQYNQDNEQVHHLSLSLSLFFFFWPRQVACRILVHGTVIEPGPPLVEAQCPIHWTAREFLTPVSLQSFLPAPLSHPVPRQPLICFLSLQISLHFTELHVNGIIQYILFIFC